MAEGRVVYQIVDWKTFENHESKKLEHLNWVPFPNTIGLTLAKLLNSETGLRDFGFWCALVQLASRKPKPRDGWLTSDGQRGGDPYTIDDLAVMFRCSLQNANEAMGVLTGGRIAWVELHARAEENTENRKNRTEQNSIREKIPNSGGVPGDAPDAPGDSPDTSPNKYSADFEEFWAAYPRKVGKKAAFRAWKISQPDSALRSRMLAVLADQKRSEQWQREGGQFIPHPTTWLSQGRWEDDVSTYAQNGQENMTEMERANDNYDRNNSLGKYASAS